jgi:transcriptional regulator with XRE-family HTH domain
MMEKAKLGSIGLGERLRHAVAQRCKTEKCKVNDLCRKIGIARQTLNVHELGTQIPKADLIERYAEALGVNSAWLAFGVGEMKAGKS